MPTNNESGPAQRTRNDWSKFGIPSHAPAAAAPSSPILPPMPRRTKNDWNAFFVGDEPPQKARNNWDQLLAAKPSAQVTTPVVPTLRQFIGEEEAGKLTPERALEAGHVQNYLDLLREKAETLEVGSPEREKIAKTIAGLQSDQGEFDRQNRESKKQGVSREAIVRLESEVGAFEREISQAAVGQTAMRMEQAASNIAETVLSQGDRLLGEGKLSAAIHKDKTRRDEFLYAAEHGGQIEQMLGETGSRIYNNAVNSVTKNAMVGAVAGPAAVYSLIAGESHDDALEEARVNGLSGSQAQVYAGTKAATELGVTLLFGQVGKKLGLDTLEESFSPGFKKAAANIVNKQLGKHLPKWAAEVAGVGAESAEELTVDAIHQGIEFAAGVRTGFDWQRLFEAGATGGIARGAVGGTKALAEQLSKIPSQKIEETVKGVAVAEQAIAQIAAKEAAPAVPNPVAATLASPADQAAFEKIAAHQVQVEGPAGARGLNRALQFIQSATPEMLQAAAQPMTAKQFQQLTGLKKTSELFRAAFRDTLNVYAGVEKSQNEAPAARPSQSPQEPATLAPAESESVRPSTNGTQQAASQGPTAGQPPLAAPAALVPTAPLTNAGRIRTWLKEHFTSAGLRNAEIDAANDARLGQVGADLITADHLRADLNSAVKAEFGGRGRLTAEQVRKIDDALKGKPTDLPESILAAIEPMRAHVDSLSRRLLESGVIDPESEMGITVDENMGSYLTRTYRKHEQKTWPQVAKQNAELMDKTRAWLRAQFPGDSADVTEWRINMLLDKDSAAAKVPAGISKQDRDFTALLKERKLDNEPVLRELYGEYRDPWINYTKSIAKMANLLAHKQFMGTVKAAGLATGFLSDEKSPRPGNYRRINASDTPRLAELDGLYTDPQTAKALQDLFSAETHSALYRYASKLSSIGKWNATVGNSKVHVRNFVGNIQFAMANGDMLSSPAAFGKAAKATIDHLLRDGGGAEQRSYLRRLTELGLVDSSVDVGDVRAMAGEMADLDGAPNPGLIGMATDAVAGLNRMYQAGDAFWKVLAFENKKQQYARAYPDQPYDAIEKLAAADVRDHYPTYSKLPKGVRKISQFPLAAPFISFPAESLRTLKNTVTTIGRELKSANPAVREMGMQRAVGLTASFAVVPAIATISKAVVGITPEEEDDLRKFQPPWSQNAQFLYLGKDGSGNYDLLDLSFLDARSIISKPLMAALRSDDLPERFDNAAKELITPFGEDLFFGRVLSVLRNKTLDGRTIFNEEAPEGEKAAEIGFYLGQPLVPGTVPQLDRIRRGLAGEVSRGGKVYDAQLEAAATLGLRVSSTDTKQSFTYRNLDFIAAMRSAERGIIEVANSRGTVTPGQLAHAYDSYNRQRAKLAQEWHEMAMSAIRLGVPQNEVAQTLRTFAGDDKARMILSGRYVPYRPSEETLRTIITRPDGRARAMQMIQLYREMSEKIEAELKMP
jgi:hypothetical protein